MSSQNEEYCFNMYVCQGCREESEDPDFTECCEGHSVFAETRYSNDDDDSDEEEEEEKGLTLQDVPDDIKKMVWDFVSPNASLLNRKGWVSAIIPRIPHLLKTLKLTEMNKWNNRSLKEGEKPFRETRKLIESNMCYYLKNMDYENIFELYERLMVFQTKSTRYYQKHLSYLFRSDYWEDVCEKARQKAHIKFLKKCGEYPISTL
jgi:hypothetical protein|nr:MAG: hypothetical protein [Lake Baikal virophage 10]